MVLQPSPYRAHELDVSTVWCRRRVAATATASAAGGAAVVHGHHGDAAVGGADGVAAPIRPVQAHLRIIIHTALVSDAAIVIDKTVVLERGSAVRPARDARFPAVARLYVRHPERVGRGRAHRGGVAHSNRRHRRCVCSLVHSRQGYFPSGGAAFSLLRGRAAEAAVADAGGNFRG